MNDDDDPPAGKKGLPSSNTVRQCSARWLKYLASVASTGEPAQAISAGTCCASELQRAGRV